MSEICLLGAFLGGLFSFLSPCVLPLVPSYVSFITGISFEDFKHGNKAHIRKITILSSLSFILGFSLIFILLGVFSSFVGRIFVTYYDEIRIIGGTIIIFFGLYVMGVFKIRTLSMEKRVHLKSKPRGYIGSFVVGVTFAAGWTPCIGPILGTILLIAGSTGSALYGFKLLIVYSAGLAVPFFITSLLMTTFISHFSFIQKFIRPIMILSGLLLIAFGILFFMDKLTYLVGLSPESLEILPGKFICK